MEVAITSKNFATVVIESKIPVLIDFWAPWCGPCKIIAPNIEAVAKEQKGKIKVCKINVDEAPDVATKFTVMSIPTVMIFKGGKVMEKKVGSLSKRDLDKLIQPYL
ncbi:MAG: thioredoxin [Candidatus Omnitrophica bacterium]|nr:thioredoxin [Candidatus Omnitrophota bacterium]